MFCERGADYVPVYALPRTWDGKDKKEEAAERGCATVIKP